MKTIDYTKETEIYFWKLEELEVQRQGREKDRKLRNVRIKLLCDNCRKPFIKWLHDPALALSFCCSDECLKEIEKKAREEMRKEDTYLLKEI